MPELHLQSVSASGKSAFGLHAARKIREFHRSLPGYRVTPLHSLPKLAKDVGLKNLFIKDERHRFGLNAFKVLGASYALQKVLESFAGVQATCTASDGNHGRALAWISKHISLPCKVFLPAGTIPARIEAIRNEGAEVEICPGDYDLALTSAKKWAATTGAVQVQDTSWRGYRRIPRWIMQGYLTQVAELSEQLFPNQQVDLVVLQAGVGTWAAALAPILRSLTGADILIVEATNSCGFLRSIQTGKLATCTNSEHTIMAGLDCPTPGITAWEILKETAHGFLAIEDRSARTAIWQLSQEGIESGASGCAGFAGLLALSNFQQGRDLLARYRNVLLFNTEGYTNPEDDPFKTEKDPAGTFLTSP